MAWSRGAEEDEGRLRPSQTLGEAAAAAGEPVDVTARGADAGSATWAALAGLVIRASSSTPASAATPMTA